MREVQFTETGEVPGVARSAVSYLLVLCSIAMLVIYVDYIGRSLRVLASSSWSAMTLADC